ncbi:MAG: Tad domain-containing protein [Bdellovibrionales bacterium]|nr:Tad domain-containing protein [Bdellovibrionales bacterium]
MKTKNPALVSMKSTTKMKQNLGFLNRFRRVSTCEGGQISILIALIFQVLFVIFAMAINIGLLVHDKINLQNSVDLAAYYGAQRQAEILNAIAHENYQIRQSWKLLAFRVRVLGDMGRATHPLFDQRAPSGETPIVMNDGGAPGYPTVCWNHFKWKEKHWFTSETSQNLQICRAPNTLRIPPLPATQDLTGFFLPLNAVIQNITQDLSSRFGNDCMYAGPSNFLMAATWLVQFKLDMAQKKQRIRALAERLQGSVDDFRDLSGESVLVGVRNTFRNNLTRSNRDGSPAPRIRMFNSMGMMSDRRQWINEVNVVPYIFYTDFAGGSTSSGCDATRRLLNDPNNGVPQNIAIDPRFEQAIQAFRTVIYETPNEDFLYQTIVGVEKNPWVMAYVGVTAETTPRKPFAPFGSPVTLRAEAFAKPFGGRIGPWMYTKWDKDSFESSGGYDDRVDQLLPPVLGIDAGQNPLAYDHIVPNYSRWPGDRLGLRSANAVSNYRGFTASIVARRGFSYQFYNAATAGVGPNGYDPLAFDYSGANQAEPLRRMETAAIAPDVFDITYYSIDPNFYTNYSANYVGSQPFPYTFDLGPNFRGPNSIMAQVVASQNILGSTAPWKVLNWSNTLTGWVPNNINDYGSLDLDSFGQCIETGNIPGSCAIGGRTGYSVKIVSAEYLRSPLPLGNNGDTAPIKNPPPPNF